MRSTCGVERGLPDGAATQCFWRQELIVGRGGNGLASTVTCRRCGRTPDASFAFCPYCGTPLSGAAYRGFSVGTPTTVLPPAAASYPPWTTGTPVSYARRREVDRTRTGVLLLAAGSAIGWIPVISILGIELATTFLGAVVIEQVFTLPGLGSMLLLGIEQRDYPNVQGVLFVSTLLVLTIGFAADFVQRLIDPRLRDKISKSRR